MPSKSLSSLLIISVFASLSLATIAIIPIYYEASAKKECRNNDDSSCSDKQDSNSNDGSSVKKDKKTPFVLAVPFP
jgi:hypothetical protein